MAGNTHLLTISWICLKMFIQTAEGWIWLLSRNEPAFMLAPKNPWKEYALEIQYSEPQNQQRGRGIGMRNSWACLHPSALHCQYKGPARNAAARQGLAGRAGLGCASAEEAAGAGPGALRAAGAQPGLSPALPAAGPACSPPCLQPLRACSRPCPAGTRRARRVSEAGQGSLCPPWGRASRHVPPQPLRAPSWPLEPRRVNTVTLRLEQALGNKICCHNRKSM